MRHAVSRCTRRSLVTATAATTAPACVEVNGTRYRVPAAGSRPLVAVCLDGCGPSYLEEAMAAGKMPFLSGSLAAAGWRDGGGALLGLATAAMPTYTNPNNVSIVTGAAPSVTGISGNYFFDEATGEEVMMNDARYLRCGTVLAALAASGVQVTVVTAKHKLLGLLTAGLPASCSAVSAEREAEVRRLAALGVDLGPPPGIYDPEISVYCLEAALGLLLLRLRQRAPQVYYVSTTDYVQHKHPPGSEAANEFLSRVDSVLGRMHGAGAAVAVTADHGMNDKVNFDGSPRVVYAESMLRAAAIECRVVLPITDPYVAHHGSLGSYATVYVRDKARVPDAAALLRSAAGMYTVLDRNEACRNFDLPADRIGDLVLVGDAGTVIGRTPEHHDLTQVPRLRSHGGLEEATVPLYFSRGLDAEHSRRLARGLARNYHLFEYLLNGSSSCGV